MFCMNCGQQLPDGAKFCLSCGTRQGEVSAEPAKKADAINLDGSHTFVPAMCPNCSAHMKVDSSNRIARCESCGTECLVQDAIKALNVKGNVHVSNATINISGTNAESLLQRVEIMLADGDFSGAMAKCDTILDLDPTNGRVYLFMLMANLKCRYRKELAYKKATYEGNQYFRKAIQYGDDNLKDELLGYLNTVVDRNKAEEEAELIRHETQLRHLRMGEEFYFGRFNSQKIWWKVIRVVERRALVISCKSICSMPYHQPGGEIAWKHCTLRHWLNNDFINSCFSYEEKAKILFYSNKKNKDLNTDKIVVFDRDEVIYYFPKPALRISDGWWWLRSSGIFAHHGDIVDTHGLFPFTGRADNMINTNTCCGVRPAMWISLD